MLTRGLLRWRVENGLARPMLLRPTPANTAQAQELLDFWRAGTGQRRGDLEDAAMPLLHRSRNLVAGRGLQKLILDESRFTEPASAEPLRAAALSASAALLAKPAPEGDAHRAAVAEALGLDAEDLARRLYGDLPDAAVLEAAPAWTARQLLDRYNLALCQGLLLSAKELAVTVWDADAGLRRQLIKALRFRRLLAEVTMDADAAPQTPNAGPGSAPPLRLTISGPASVLDQASRYGLQLALFLPALACAKRWSATAEIAVGRHGGGTARLELSDATGLVGDTAFLGFVPEELRDLGARLAAQCPEWRFSDPQLLPLPSGELVAADLQIESGGVTVAVELFHRWHGHALARRLDQCAAGLLPRLGVGVNRALARTAAVKPLLDHPAFARHGFLFSDLPTVRALREVVERLTPTAGGV
jgi:predicted nuclease of restriction endonuclease-like RecB superfamily